MDVVEKSASFEVFIFKHKKSFQQEYLSLLRPFEFIATTNHMTVQIIDLLKLLPVCFFYFSAKRLLILCKSLMLLFLIQYFKMKKS